MMRVLPVLMLASCLADPCPDGGMVASPRGLTVTQAEHGEGWQHADCEACHAIPALHLRACTEDIDMEVLRDQVDVDGYDSCVDCHGDNGVSP